MIFLGESSFAIHKINVCTCHGPVKITLMLFKPVNGNLIFPCNHAYLSLANWNFIDIIQTCHWQVQISLILFTPVIGKLKFLLILFMPVTGKLKFCWYYSSLPLASCNWFDTIHTCQWHVEIPLILFIPVTGKLKFLWYFSMASFNSSSVRPVLSPQPLA